MMLRFGQIEDVLQRVHGIPESGRTAFRAKLRNLFRVGLTLPSGSTGRKANFHPADLFKLAFVVELLQSGLTPERAALSVAQHWPDLVEQFFAARKSIQEGRPSSHFLVAEPQLLADGYIRFRPVDGATLAKRVSSNEAFGISRLLIINPGAMLMEVVAAAALADIDMDAFGASLDEDQAVILREGARVGPQSGFIAVEEGE